MRIIEISPLLLCYGKRPDRSVVVALGRRRCTDADAVSALDEQRAEAAGPGKGNADAAQPSQRHPRWCARVQSGLGLVSASYVS